MEHSSQYTWRNYSCPQKIEVINKMKKKDLHSQLVSIVSFTSCYQQKEVFDKFHAVFYDPSNNHNDKDSWILLQVPTIMDDFDTTALEDIINCPDIDLPTSQSRCTGYLESVAKFSQGGNLSLCVEIW